MTDVDYVRVHEAMRLVGVKLERERLERIAKRDAVPTELTCSTCGAPARRYMNTRACIEHTPAKLAGHAEPPTRGCTKPLACYRPCCVQVAPPSNERRAELDAEIEKWRSYARAEILQVASIGLPFGPRELAALLPVKLAKGRAREWLTQLLDEGVNAGALVQLDKASWRLRRDGEPVQVIETSATPYRAPRVDTDRVERDNRYQ